MAAVVDLDQIQEERVLILAADSSGPLEYEAQERLKSDQEPFEKKKKLVYLQREKAALEELKRECPGTLERTLSSRWSGNLPRSRGRPRLLERLEKPSLG